MDRIQHAKRIMKPFFLRRLKADVLKALPEKTIELLKVPMTTEQHMTYFRLVQEYKKRAKDVSFFKKITSLFLAIKNLMRKSVMFLFSFKNMNYNLLFGQIMYTLEASSF